VLKDSSLGVSACKSSSLGGSCAFAFGSSPFAGIGSSFAGSGFDSPSLIGSVLGSSFGGSAFDSSSFGGSGVGSSFGGSAFGSTSCGGSVANLLVAMSSTIEAPAKCVL